MWPLLLDHDGARIEAVVVEGAGVGRRRSARDWGRGWERAGRNLGGRHNMDSCCARCDGSVCYNGRKAEAIVHWRGEPGRAPTSLRIQGKASAEQARAAVEPKGPVVCAAERLPRMTRLLALAVRLEGVLREGAIGSGAELARLGRGVAGTDHADSEPAPSSACDPRGDLVDDTGQPGDQADGAGGAADAWGPGLASADDVVRAVGPKPGTDFSRAERVSGSLETE